WIDPQAGSVPLEQVTLARQKIHDRSYRTLGVGGADLLVAEMQPEFVRGTGQGNRYGDGIVAVGGFFDEADDVVVVHLQKAQVGGLQQRRVVAADRVQLFQIILNVAGFVPVAR